MVLHHRGSQSLDEGDQRQPNPGYQTQAAQQRGLPGKEESESRSQIGRQQGNEDQEERGHPVHAEKLQRPGDGTRTPVTEATAGVKDRPEDQACPDEHFSGDAGLQERYRTGAPEDVDVHQCDGGCENDSEQVHSF